MDILSQFAQTTYYYSETEVSGGDSATAAFVAFLVFGFIFFAAILGYVIHAFLLGRIFKKAGIKQWIAWVPVYNAWKLLELGGQQGFWAILMLIPFVNIVAAIFLYIAMYHVGLKLQKEGWFVVLAILIPIVWMAWLAFDSSKWQEPGAPKSKTPTAADDNSTPTVSKKKSSQAAKKEA